VERLAALGVPESCLVLRCFVRLVRVPQVDLGSDDPEHWLLVTLPLASAPFVHLCAGGAVFDIIILAM
jgi:hypothetical protein